MTAYYKCKVFGINSPGLFLFDVAPADVSRDLYLFGSVFTLNFAYMTSLGKEYFMEKAIFEAIKIEPECRDLLEEYREARQKKPPVSEHADILHGTIRLEAFRANHHLLYFLMQVLIFYIQPGYKKIPEKNIIPATKFIVKCTSSLESYFGYGPAGISIISRALRADKRLFSRLLPHGILPALVNGAVSPRGCTNRALIYSPKLLVYYEFPKSSGCFPEVIYEITKEEWMTGLSANDSAQKIIDILLYIFDLNAIVSVRELVHY